MLRDWKSFDVLTASMGASDATMTVMDASFYANRWFNEIDQEVLMIGPSATSSGTSQNVMRGMFGTIATSHVNASSILVRPEFYSVEILDALNEAIMSMFPAIYKPVVDTSVAIATNTYSYVIPSMPGYTNYPMPYVWKASILQPGDYRYRQSRRFSIRRGASTSGSSTTTSSSSLSPAIEFKSLPPVGSTLMLQGFGPFAPLSALTDTLDTLFPPGAEYLLPIYAAGSLLMSGEAGRVRVDTEAVDTREQANRVGASSDIGMRLLARFRQELTMGAASSAMPPLPRHVRSTI